MYIRDDPYPSTLNISPTGVFKSRVFSVKLSLSPVIIVNVNTPVTLFDPDKTRGSTSPVPFRRGDGSFPSDFYLTVVRLVSSSVHFE